VDVWAAVPDAAELMVDSLGPDLAYDTSADIIRWRGTVHPGAPRLLEWSARLRPDLALGAHIVTRAEIRARSSGVPTVRLQHATRIRSADLSGSTKVASPPVARRQDLVHFTLRAANAGATATEVEVTDALPPGLRFAAGSAVSSAGEPPAWDETGNSLRWRGVLPAAGAVEVRFAAVYDGPGTVTNVMRVANTAGAHFAAWAEVRSERARVYLPAAGR